MRVSPNQPYQLVYSLEFHDQLGPLLYPYVVQVNEFGNLTLCFQKIYSHTLKGFPQADTDVNREIIRKTDSISQEKLFQKFAPTRKKIRPQEFLVKGHTPEIQERLIAPYIEEILSDCLLLLRKGPIYLKGKNGNPAELALQCHQDTAVIEFTFNRSDVGTEYQLSVEQSGRVQQLSAAEECRIICNKPAWVQIDNQIIHFEKGFESKKLRPFFLKDSVSIPSGSEENYYRKFVLPLIRRFKVTANGFEISRPSLAPTPVLAAFHKEGTEGLLLYFRYDDKTVPYHSDERNLASFDSKSNPWRFNLIERDRKQEDRYRQYLEKIGLNYKKHSTFSTEKGNPILWVNRRHEQLTDKGFEIISEGFETPVYLGGFAFKANVIEENDWFDLLAVIEFNGFNIPFQKFKRHIIDQIKEFKLPDGSVFLIPDEWFAKYRDLLLHGETINGSIRLSRHHFNLIQPFTQDAEAKEMSEFIRALNQVHEGKKQPLPAELKKILRSYQHTGYSWLTLLSEFGFGGCLADDMGLGKTLQTLALLQSAYDNQSAAVLVKKEEEVAEGQMNLFGSVVLPEKEEADTALPSLLIMPSSLVHNWYNEIIRFTPRLRVHIHTGSDRVADPLLFRYNDIVITTYGIARNDLEFLKGIEFRYIILDESQTIKNPGSKIAKAVSELNSENRFVLTGTPIENSLSDLWSQMNFINPGILGSYTFFKKEFVTPIEKKADIDKKRKLKRLITPYILRRTKESVAKELPPLTETVHYCEMTPAQRSHYERAKSRFRNLLLKNIKRDGINRHRFVILKGLMELRLIANHPVLANRGGIKDSGKYQEITRQLEELVNNNHKILVFSQFVKHLDLIKAYLDDVGLASAILTGSTRNRQAEIEKFTNKSSVNIFLISLKAGGVGLNLTAADYVFILDPWWNPFSEKQAIDRAYRIGQDKNVFSYKFITKDSIEDKILRLQRRKKSLAEDFIPNHSLSELITVEELEHLLQ